MTLSIKVTPGYIAALKKDFERARKNLPHSEVTILARHMIERAIKYDQALARNLPAHFKYKGIVRDALNPPEFEHSELVGVDYADDPARPLKAGNEKWNEGSRATATGQTYELDDKGRPLNPYMNAGLNGRGILGEFGPNHAVDNGMLIIRKDETGRMVLYMLGITRKYDHDAPALAGGFAKYARGATVFDDAAMIETKVEEFFEEVISGSVPLLSEYAAQVESRFAKVIANIEDKRGAPVAQDYRDEIHDQTITALKLEQVRAHDPEFLRRLSDHIADSHECFAGPVLNDPRNTNNAWIESRLSWAVFNDATWTKIKGDAKFDYQLTGGDDASSVVWHKFGAGIVGRAYASHGVMMTMMAVSYILDVQAQGKTVDPVIMEQCREVVHFLKPGE